MATPTPTPTPIPPLHIKSAARKLPIKRKPTSSSHDPSDSLLSRPQDPNPSPLPPLDLPTPNPDPDPDPDAIVTDNNNNNNNNNNNAFDDDYDAYDDEEEEEDDEDEEEGGGSQDGGAIAGGELAISSSSGGGGGRLGGDLKASPPFKFHRIWSESDEIRFLQGLLGCWSQGMVFPRDLNLFYDRFSESMPQPYTRSQLSEKLRRLRKKFRIMSGRIARGQDPSRLAPHDRDLLHLCTRLWHPDHAASSPFSSPDAAVAGTTGNKRRRPNPRAPTALSRAVGVSGGSVSPPPPTPPPQLLPPTTSTTPMATPVCPSTAVPPPPRPAAAESPVPVNGDQIKYLSAKMVLDVFDESLKELQRSLPGCLEKAASGDLAKRWQEQRVAELDVFARRMRLVLEQSLQN